MQEDGDSGLVQRCREGDRQAFGILVVRYQRPVFNVALRMLRNPDDARDVAQTVFLKAYEHLAEFDPKYRFYSWIYRIAVNESINVLGRRKRLEPVEDDEIDGARGPDEVLDGELMSRNLQAALMTLKPEYRAVIVLRHFLECSYEDIGDILQVPEKTVKSRLFSARQLLGERLRRHGIL